MDSILVHGGQRLQGAIPISGAKNACLTLMPAALLTDEPVTLTNAPRLSDIRTMTTLLESLGCEVASLQQGRVLVIGTQAIASHRADYEIVRKMRASILVLGPMLARDGHAVVSLPGGCAIGARPVDLHLRGLEALGAELDLRDGYVHATAPTGLRGAVFEFPLVSVGATENVLMAATLARGTTVLKNAAREPEIVDLAQCLRRMGAEISGEGTSTIEIRGVDRLHGATHPVVADRIELGTYMLAPAIAGGEVELVGGRRELVAAFADKLEEAGDRGHRHQLRPQGQPRQRPRPRRRRGDRALPRLPDRPAGADDGAARRSPRGPATSRSASSRTASCTRPSSSAWARISRCTAAPPPSPASSKLRGAPVMATDLRASVSLILAGLAAEGETRVARVYHLDRGYERVEEKLSACGARIERLHERAA